MKLKSSPTSPYVRKVLVTAIETGLRERIETTDVDTSKAEETRSAENPLGKIPALTTDDGAVLFDSPVICEYLASLAETGAVFPPRGEARWTALRRQALADGILDASLFRRYEGMRPEGLRSDEWSARQKGKVERALDALEAEADTLGDGITIGHIALGCALGYLDFRFAGDDWRRGRPRLDAWYGTFSKRPSMTGTAPPE